MDHATAARLKQKRTLSNALANTFLAILGLQGGIAIGAGVIAQPMSDWSHPNLAITAVSRIAAMVGTFLALMCLVLIARVPWLEREIGQDRLVKWHRSIAPYSLYLIVLHVILVSVGYGMLDGIQFWSEFWRLTLGSGWMLPAFVGFIFMMMVGITSYKRARSKMQYETWWLLHLYSYLGISLAFMHQIVMGTMFLNSPNLKIWWIAVYILVYGFILLFRVLIPLSRSLRHDLRVEKVVRESHNTVSVIMRGRNIDDLKAQGGQFFAWRFLDSHHWWEAHPYSLSASPRNDRLRITVKNLGDHSHWLASVRPGTRVMVEGPYGVFTADRSSKPHAVLIAGGVGITPIRALLEELPKEIDVDVVWRASNDKDLVLRKEVEALADWRGARIHYMVGTRKQHPLNPKRLAAVVPGIGSADVFLCGPDGMVNEAKTALRHLGIPEDHIHDEAFAY